MVFSHLTLMGGGILTSRSPSLSQMLRPVPACILITFLTITSVPPIRQITQMLRILGVGSTPFPDTTVPAHAILADPAHATAPIAFRMTFSYQAGQFAAVPAIVDELLIGHVINVHSHTSPLVNLRNNTGSSLYNARRNCGSRQNRMNNRLTASAVRIASNLPYRPEAPNHVGR
jgi:hypothetical protein|nr:MAG: hypothetical protein [Bacteriophage sp.]